jgi:hypothetical protein
VWWDISGRKYGEVGESRNNIYGSRSEPGTLIGVGPGPCRIFDMNFREFALERLSENSYARTNRLTISRVIAA